MPPVANFWSNKFFLKSIEMWSKFDTFILGTNCQSVPLNGSIIDWHARTATPFSTEEGVAVRYTGQVKITVIHFDAFPNTWAIILVRNRKGRRSTVVSSWSNLLKAVSSNKRIHTRSNDSCSITNPFPRMSIGPVLFRSSTWSIQHYLYSWFWPCYHFIPVELGAVSMR